MAGDHKCPVCQSTFTRPQHVARHMRSHTGDRPYKCQHCGDQFARSDLLSRHINKCHASEKPPTTTAPSRRKGFAAASRATTSKQACDQCVTSSLPCDGANPCSKCVSRKCRCTYIKFHRQTAPAGPGHPVPPTLPPPGIGRHDISLGAPRLPNEFLLAPPPGTMNLSSMYAHQYALPPQSSAVYPHDYTSLPPLATALAPNESPMPSVLQMQQQQHRDLLDNPDAMARIRAQAELLGRAGVMPNGNLTLAQPAPSADTSGALPGLYAAAAQDGQYDRYPLPPPPQWEAQRHYSQKDFEEPYGQRSQSHPTAPSSYSTAGLGGGEPSLQTHPPTASSSYQGNTAPGAQYQHGALPATSLYGQHHTQHHQSRSDDIAGSEGDYHSDAGSTGTSHSVPSSANNSAVHLPLPGFNNLRTRADMGVKEYEQRYQHDAQNANPHEGEGGFSSAFGLMSLDDPNVLAGLQNDGQPFFSGMPFTPGASGNGNGLSFPTPTPDLIAQLKSAGGREGMDSKEMRDFWKMYLKTPLTSSGGIMFPLQTPTGPGSQLGHGMGGNPGTGRPSPSRRHSRVASLPSMKTPPLFADERLGSYARPSTGHGEPQGNANAYQGEGQDQGGGYNSTVRTTLHGDAEDLKSYEQAVLARKAPMTLNLMPKRKGSVAAAAAAGAAGKSKSMSPVVPPAAFNHNHNHNHNLAPSTSLPGASKISELLNRPGSSSSADTNATGSSGGGGAAGEGGAGASTGNTSLSSLAHAFQHDAQADAGAGAGDGNAYMSQQAYRPSFKRLASQTLGPPNAKRALLGPAGWDQDDVDEDEDEGGEDEEEERARVREEEEGRRAGGYGDGARSVAAEGS
ncbi:hypothetical protein K466DRAFT_510997 [Polyporus arcularius HHB13444]|uniref:Zn(2)-C6 fungal-type domain-containing protein n=1 Tax=Polyporus arcularius HHB13444 TaxID=1314778 RepID=A0A5C3PVG4_9APHY|nr:hypothetical protein K466DRAFT_510997 [Polyporus arcularius HHB13444]